MSLLAGIFSRTPERALPESACARLVAALTRAPGEAVEVVRDARCLLAKVDRGAFGAPGLHRDAGGAVSLLAGEPLLESGPGAGARAADLARLHADLLRGGAGALREARGVFALAQYDPAAGTLRLASDRLGVRPLYYWTGPDLVVFASALRVLEAVDAVPRVMDLRGAVEVAAIGIPLGRRTAYAGVERIAAGEVVSVDADGVARAPYWRWDRLEPPGLAGEALAREVDARFRDAVSLRLGADRATLAFLSGGMDSRAVVATLRARGAAVHTFNFSPPGMQDHAFAAAFAERAGTLHRHFPMRHELEEAKFSDTLAHAWAGSPLREAQPPERPALAWSGDGGSVGMGHVYLGPEIVRLARAGKPAEAADVFLRSLGLGLPRRILRRRAAEELAEIPRAGVVEELAALDCADPARGFHLFLMLNDQRRHLTGHFEHLDLHGVELQLPFFDARLLELVLASPVDPFLGHGLYHEWFGLLPPEVRSVPWQTYPGHVPCPLPVPPELGYQWDRRSFAWLRARRRRRLLGQAARMLASPRFPAAYLRRAPVATAALATATGVRDCSTLLRAAAELHRVHAACGGRVAPHVPTVPAAGRSAPAGAAADSAPALAAG